MSDEITITIKYGKGYDDSWAVFRGTPAELRANILDFYGMDPDSQRGLSLSSVVVNATNIAQGKSLVATQLGGAVIAETKNEAEPAKPTDDPWAAAASAQSSAPASSASVAKPSEDPNAYILGEIAKQTTVEGLKKVWAANQSFFANPDVMASWKAKGKALSAAA